MSRKLDEAQLKSVVAALPEWELEEGELTRTLIFENFKKAIDFVNKIAILAEEANHHPDIDIRYNHVRLRLITHDAGGITQKDVELSEKIDCELGKRR